MSMGHVLLPLYIYPDNYAWQNVLNNITSQPGLNFSVVVNPASGPGPANSFPDANYISNISALNQYSNVQVLGYVDTDFANQNGRAPFTKVKQDITTYHNWATYLNSHPGMDIHVDGIFFDDCNNTYTSKAYAYYKNVSATAKQIMGSGFQHVLFNAGAGVDYRYFALADEIIIYEDFYSNYTDDVPYRAIVGTTNDSVTETFWNQSSILIHHFYDNATRQQQIIDNLIGNNFQGLYISTTGDYNNTQVNPYVVSNTGYSNGPYPNSKTNYTRDERNSGIYEYISSLFDRFVNDMY